MPEKWVRVTIGLAASIIILGVLLYLVPKWQIPSEGIRVRDRVELENEHRRTLAQVMLGILVLGGAYLTWRRVKAAEQAVTVSQEQQITERFTRAVEQLGSSEMAIRLGGIYALERIARDSPNKDQRQVVEVLTAYLRENARHQKLGQKAFEVGYEMPTDWQAILTVLGRRERDDLRLDLSRTFLRKANLYNSQLEGVILSLAVLKDANLFQANFAGAFLEGADLREAILSESNFVGSHLGQAVWFDGDEYNEPEFRSADLSQAFLDNANFAGADLFGANLTHADLKGANFVGADLRSVEGLTEAQLSSASTDRATKLPPHLIDEEDQHRQIE